MKKINPQELVMKRLEESGFRFSNWIPFQPDANGDAADGTEGQQTAVMIRKVGLIREYREVEPNGGVS